MSLSLSSESISKEPDKLAKSLPVSLLVNFLKKATFNYENKQPIISDYTYDIVYDIVKKRDPNNIFFKSIGYSVTNDKVNLPIHMGSMNKLKDSNSINNWCMRYHGPNYIVSSKLDGISALCVCKNESYSMFTRGNGSQGRNISHIVPYLNLNLKSTGKSYMVRGELVISKKNFNIYGKDYSSSRSMINGIVNKKEADLGLLKYVDFVVFEVVEYDSVRHLLPYSQFIIAEKIGFKVVSFNSLSRTKLLDFNSLTLEKSSIMKFLLKYRLESEYDMDGIIITENKEHVLNKEGNPDYSFAFKTNGLGIVTNVKNVEWNISKHGQLIPRIEIDPICIDNTNIKYTTGFNGKFIVDNSIGVGSKVRVIRSGDVIPHIIEVIEKSLEPIMPNVPYNWTETGVNMIVDNVSDDLEYKRILAFFKTLKIEFVSDALVKKMYNSGFNTIKKLLLITHKELIELDGIQTKLSDKLYKSIHKVIDNPIDLSLLMCASLVFGHGFGVKRFNAILSEYPNILEYDMVTTDMISRVDGFSIKMSKRFSDNIKQFKQFLTELDFIKVKKNEVKTSINGRFNGINIVLTGFRDETIETYINTHGGSVKNGINKNTSILIIKNEAYTSSKIDTATLLGIKIMTKEEFLKLI
jgi:NAD-dependent DNA ligase